MITLNGKDGHYYFTVLNESGEELFAPIRCISSDVEFAGEYIKKGRQVVVDGRISISKWTDQTGEEKERFLVIANNVRLLGSKRDAE